MFNHSVLLLSHSYHNILFQSLVIVAPLCPGTQSNSTVRFRTTLDSVIMPCSAMSASMQSEHMCTISYPYLEWLITASCVTTSSACMIDRRAVVLYPYYFRTLVHLPNLLFYIRLCTRFFLYLVVWLYLSSSLLCRLYPFSKRCSRMILSEWISRISYFTNSFSSFALVRFLIVSACALILVCMRSNA